MAKVKLTTADQLGSKIAELSRIPPVEISGLGGQNANIDKYVSPNIRLLEFLVEVDESLHALRPRFQDLLTSLAGINLKSFEANRAVASLIQDIADRLRVSLACPGENCDEAPSRLRCSRIGNIPTGAFTFSHERHTHGGTSTLPPLKVVELAPDRRAEKKNHEIS